MKNIACIAIHGLFTDKKIEKGNQSLLIYPAIVNPAQGLIIVSNGAQTNLIYSEFINKEESDPGILLHGALKDEFYIYDPENRFVDITSTEPDVNNTPRISGVISYDKAALHIVRQIKEETKKEVFPFKLEPSRGRLIATYKGIYVDILQSFEGNPIDVEFDLDEDHKELAASVYRSLAPKDSEGRDFRVAVAVMSFNMTNLETKLAIVNNNR